MSDEDMPADIVRPKIVIAEFDAWIQDTEELFDTTHEDMAKEKEIFDEKMIYEPQPLLLGRERLFRGLEKSMLEANIETEYEVVLSPEDAAGPRDPKLVELFPLREFLKQDISPRVGLQVTIKNRIGYISAVTAGRVRVDFNNRLAGRTLKYKYKIISEPKSSEEIFNSVLKMNYGSSEGFSVNFDDDKAIVKLPDVCKYDQRWLLSKLNIINDLRELLEIDIIQLVEEYTKTKKEEEEEKEEKLSEESSPEKPSESEKDIEKEEKNDQDN